MLGFHLLHSQLADRLYVENNSEPGESRRMKPSLTVNPNRGEPENEPAENRYKMRVKRLLYVPGSRIFCSRYQIFGCCKKFFCPLCALLSRPGALGFRVELARGRGARGEGARKFRQLNFCQLDDFDCTAEALDLRDARKRLGFSRRVFQRRGARPKTDFGRRSRGKFGL